MSKKTVLDALTKMSDSERRELLHELKEQGITVSARAPKKEKVAVAYRVQTVDTKPNARRPRKAGEVFPMTDKSLEMTVKTWVRGKKDQDVDALHEAKIAEVKAGATLEFSSFKIVPASVYESQTA